MKERVVALLKHANGDEEEGRKDVPKEDVARFLKDKPKISDKRFHEWTERKGYHTPSAESKAYGLASKMSALMHGGKSSGKVPEGVPAEDVKRGVKIEHEHTGDKEVARKITADHTTEFKNYYNKEKGLPAFEKVLKKTGTASFLDELGKIAAKKRKKRKMPHFTDQDRPKKVKDIYRALKREHPTMRAEKKARIAAKFGKPGVQKQGPPYKGPLTA